MLQRNQVVCLRAPFRVSTFALPLLPTHVMILGSTHVGMSSCSIEKRTIRIPLGTSRKDQWCRHVVQAALAAHGNGAPVVQMIPIMAGNDSDGKELLAHPPWILLQWQIGEEELVF